MLALILSLELVAGMPLTAFAAVGDGRIQYGSGTNATPQTRFYTNSSNSWGAAGPTVAGTANVGWTVSKESPTEDVTILATQSSTGKLDIFCRTGSTWTKDISNVTIGTTAATRRFDVEFEKTSGIPMVLYSTNTATTNELSYYRKTGAGCGAGSWTGPTVLNPTRVLGIVLWVELEARQTASSNVLAAAFSDAYSTVAQGGILESMIWNGSWGNESPAIAANGWSDSSIELQGTTGANAAKVFDLAFETNTGDLFVAWGTSLGSATVNGWRYATCSATLPCTWSGVQTPTGPADDATNVACAPDPGSDAIACIAQGNAGNDLSAWLWSGTAVGATTASNADATLLAAAAGDMHVDIDWVVNGTQRMAVGMYAETTTGLRYIYYDTVGAAWRTNTTSSFTPTGAPATAVQSIRAATNQNDKTQLIVTWTDANSDLWAERLVYNGAAGGATTALSTWALGNGGVALETTVSSITSMPHWFDWIKFAAANSPPTLSVSQPPSGNTAVVEGASYNVTYTLADTDNVVTAAFYYDTNADGVGGTAISGACATAAEGAGVTCSFNTSVLTPGTPYYIYGVTNDGVNPAVTGVSAGTITVNDAPTISVSQPDGTGDTVVVGDLYNITYTLADTDNVVTAAFYYDVDAVGLNGTAITGACATAAEGAGVTCSWNTTGMTPGSYYVYGITSDGVNAQASAYSPGQITINSATPTLTIGVTAGSKTTNLNSGDQYQYMNTTGCASAAACSAFTLSISSGSETVTSIKVTETGSVNATTNLSNVSLLYDTDGNFSNGVTGTFGTTTAFTTETATVSGSLAISSGTTYYFYVRAFMNNGSNYPAGGDTVNFQIAANADVGTTGAPTKTGAPVTLAGTTTIKPQITGYTNSTETALNYAASCTGCGARIGGGAGFKQTIVIAGYGFGADPGANSRDTATNKVEVVGASTNLIDDNAGASNVTAWSNTSITITTDSAVAGDTDTDWGANFGGAAALKVTAGSQAVPTNLNFYVFPQVTSITQPGGFPADSAREYNAADTDGVITLNGTRFGTGTTGGSVTIVSNAATPVADADCDAADGWANTCIKLQVPAAISNSVYTGNVAMTQGTGSNNKTHTYTTTGFRVLPRITGFTPGSGTYGDAVTVDGDHFCQNGGACPGAFSAANKVTFTSGVDATVFTSWTDTAMATQVPNSAATGNVVLTSNTTYTSNGKSFTVLSPVPSDPTSLNQYKNSGLTQAIATGDSASSTPIYLTMTMVTGVSGGTLYPQIEYKAIGTAFACSGGGACGSATTGTGVAGPGPVDCAQTGNGCSISISPADDVYHWQARVKHTKSAVDYYSNWVSFPTPTPNLESETDFKIDTTGPAITNILSGTPGSNTATITWDTSGETSTSQVQYNTTGTFVTNCATNNDCTTLNASLVFSHSVPLSNLNSGTTYYYRVRSKDAAGNETISGNNTFATASVSQPAKTIQTIIVSKITAATTTYFTLVVPETSPAVKSAYVEVFGLVSGGTNPVTIQVNGIASKDYAMNATNPIFVRLLYKVADQDTSVTESLLNFNDAAPCTNHAGGALCNKLIITPGSGMSLNIFSARFVMTYGYTP